MKDGTPEANDPAKSGQVPFSPLNGSESRRDPFDEEDDVNDYDDPWDDPDWCNECQGRGKVVTADYESYFGANYKPCPKCGGDPCIGEPPCS